MINQIFKAAIYRVDNGAYHFYEYKDTKRTEKFVYLYYSPKYRSVMFHTNISVEHEDFTDLIYESGIASAEYYHAKYKKFHRDEYFRMGISILDFLETI